jgi:hypothetical protein
MLMALIWRQLAPTKLLQLEPCAGAIVFEAWRVCKEEWAKQNGYENNWNA